MGTTDNVTRRRQAEADLLVLAEAGLLVESPVEQTSEAWLIPEARSDRASNSMKSYAASYCSVTNI